MRRALGTAIVLMLVGAGGGVLPIEVDPSFATAESSRGDTMPIESRSQASGAGKSSGAETPRILYKSPRVVAYQLRRLSESQLTLVPRSTDDPKFLPVYEALLLRPGLEMQFREEALTGLVTLNRSDRPTELIAGLRRLDASDTDASSVLLELAGLLAAESPPRLVSQRTLLERLAAEAKSSLVRRASFAALVSADGGLGRLWKPTAGRPAVLVDLIGALPMISDPALRDAFYPKLTNLIQQPPESVVRSAAISGISYIPGHDRQSFALLAELIQDDPGNTAAVVSIGRLEKGAGRLHQIESLVESLLNFASSVPLTERDHSEFLETTSVVAELIQQLPKASAAGFRQELSDLHVSARLIKTVTHQMLYDQTRLVVEAGKLVSLVFQNNDIMPHNLVVVEPGMLAVIGEASEAMAAEADARQRDYVPDSQHVLWATKLIPPGEEAKLRFVAPQQPGVYPYVCTYPGHWRRMRGALIVVADIDEYNADPEAYQAKSGLPILDEGLKRQRPLTKWTLDQLVPLLPQLAEGRSYARAKQLFRTASCAACHQLQGVGVALGPDLTKLDPKYSPRDILIAVLNPSQQIKPEFATTVFLLESGKMVAGLVREETDQVVTVVVNPLVQCGATQLNKAEIEERQLASISMMPSGLLDPLSAEEILDLLALIVARGDQQSKLFQ